MEQEQIQMIQMGVDLQKLERLNRGFNFYNFVEQKKSYINVILETEINLKEKIEIIRVETNLDCLNLGYRWEGVEVFNFLKRLENFCKKPFAKIRRINRKNKLSYWGNLRGLRDGIRDKTLNFKDIEITIFPLAEKKLKKIDLNFEKKVKELLKLMKKPDKKTQELVDRFVALNEKVLLLETLTGKGENYGYGYNKPKDKSIKIELTNLEFNEQLKAIDLELRGIAKQLKIGVEDFHYKYKKQEKKVKYSDWLKTNKQDLEENFEGFEYNKEVEENPYKSFDDYAKQMYEEFGGVIEVEWEGIPKREKVEYDTK